MSDTRESVSDLTEKFSQIKITDTNHAPEEPVLKKNNANKNGLNYEKLTYLPELLNIENTKMRFGKGKNDQYYTYTTTSTTYMILHQNGLKKYLKNHIDKTCEKILRPDECIINPDTKQLYILEKKFQQCKGTADEKIQTAPFKRWWYEKLYPDYTIIYIYVLSDWFKQKKYKPDMRYLHEQNIQVLFGGDVGYVSKLLNLLR
jgi:hypothetical protein